MPKSTNQKLKLLYLMKILCEQTDDTHAMSVQQMINELEKCGISAERKSIYDDLDALQAFGLELVCHTGKVYTYAVGCRSFGLSDLRLLSDAVRSSGFISQRKAAELNKKLETLVSVNDARRLHRQMFISSHVKIGGESIYSKIEQFHEAIAKNHKIAFQYYEGPVLRKRELHHGGKLYFISPWALTWDMERYFLIGFDEAAFRIRSFRVDRIFNISQSDEQRSGHEYFHEFDLALCAKETFGILGGGEEDVTIEFDDALKDIVLDRFGQQIPVRPAGSGRFIANVSVNVSPLFLSWLFALGTGAKVIAPDSLKQLLLEHCRKIERLYDDSGAIPV